MYEFKNPNPEKLLLKVRVVLERNTVSGGSGQGIIIAERVGWGGGGESKITSRPTFIPLPQLHSRLHTWKTQNSRRSGYYGSVIERMLMSYP